MIRVLHVIGAMDRGGAETMIMNLYRAIDRTKVQFDFLVHEQRVCDYDEEIKDLGGEVFRGLPRFKVVNYSTYRDECRDFFSRHSEHPVVHGHIGSCAPVYLREAKRQGRVTIAHSHSREVPSFRYGAGIQGVGVSRPTRGRQLHRLLHGGGG